MNAGAVKLEGSNGGTVCMFDDEEEYAMCWDIGAV